MPPGYCYRCGSKLYPADDDYIKKYGVCSYCVTFGKAKPIMKELTEATCQWHNRKLPCGLCNGDIILQPKGQVIYVPTHLKIDFTDRSKWNYPYGPTPGFVVRYSGSGVYYCRYFYPGKNGDVNMIQKVGTKTILIPELRTVSNSERTGISMLRPYDYIDPELIDMVIYEYKIEIQES